LGRVLEEEFGVKWKEVVKEGSFLLTVLFAQRILLLCPGSLNFIFAFFIHFDLFLLLVFLFAQRKGPLPQLLRMRSDACAQQPLRACAGEAQRVQFLL